MAGRSLKQMTAQPQLIRSGRVVSAVTKRRLQRDFARPGRSGYRELQGILAPIFGNYCRINNLAKYRKIEQGILLRKQIADGFRKVNAGVQLVPACYVANRSSGEFAFRLDE
jgi:hypothetical protein